MLNGKKTEKLLACIREGQEMTTREKFNLIVELSIPSMLAQISMVLMFFIDAMRTVFIRGGGLQSILHQVLALLAIGLFMGGWAVQSYKKNH